MKINQVAIIGGGLAGLTAAIHLAKSGLPVVLFEKNRFPHHKVCGEYLSNEVVPYLKSLGADLEEINPDRISRLKLGMLSGKTVEIGLPLGAMGISRYALDDFLYRKAVENGVGIIFDTVENIEFSKNRFSIQTKTHGHFESEIVLGAFGKRSNLDIKLNRDFAQKTSSWLAVKAHYENDGFPYGTVALHNFPGGYCGLSRTETGAVNLCYLVSYQSFKPYRDIAFFNAEVLSKNPFLKDFLQNSKPLFAKPLSIAQVSFEPKDVVENHILMCGDAAGLIHPLCGNGMAMAIHSGKIASESVLEYFGHKHRDRAWLENDYKKCWNKTFATRLYFGNKLQSLLLRPKSADLVVSLISRSPGLGKYIIQKTHGKPF